MNHDDCYREMYLCLSSDIDAVINQLKAIEQKIGDWYILAHKPATDITLPDDAQIRPATDLKDHYAEISAYCNTTDMPVYLTENGELSLVMLSVQAYKKRSSKK